MFKKLSIAASAFLIFFTLSCDTDQKNSTHINKIDSRGLTLPGTFPGTFPEKPLGIDSTVTDPDDVKGIDFKELTVNYTISTIIVDFSFYERTRLEWGDPYIRLHDRVSNGDRYLIIFYEPGKFKIVRDKDANGHYETVVYTSDKIKVLDFGMRYVLSIPRSVIPDVGEKNVWGYCMTSKDRIPDNGYLALNTITSVMTTDPAEGGYFDFRELEVGFDKNSIYVERDFYTPVAYIHPHVYFFDKSGNGDDYMVFVNYDYSTFDIRQDNDNNGHWETIVYSGTSGMLLDGNTRYSLVFPKSVIPDIANKKMMSYSISDQDRIPNSGYLTF